jgi:hypothetical protein
MYKVEFTALPPSRVALRRAAAAVYLITNDGSSENYSANLFAQYAITIVAATYVEIN